MLCEILQNAVLEAYEGQRVVDWNKAIAKRDRALVKALLHPFMVEDGIVTYVPSTTGVGVMADVAWSLKDHPLIVEIQSVMARYAWESGRIVPCDVIPDNLLQYLEAVHAITRRQDGVTLVINGNGPNTHLWRALFLREFSVGQTVTLNVVKSSKTAALLGLGFLQVLSKMRSMTDDGKVSVQEITSMDFEDLDMTYRLSQRKMAESIAYTVIG